MGRLLCYWRAAPQLAELAKRKPTVARKKSKPIESGYALFDVLYEDGSRTSNRRVPRTILGGLDGDAAAKDAIEEQDKTIAERAGRPRIPIKKITRSPT